MFDGDEGGIRQEERTVVDGARTHVEMEFSDDGRRVEATEGASHDQADTRILALIHSRGKCKIALWVAIG